MKYRGMGLLALALVVVTAVLATVVSGTSPIVRASTST